MARHVASINTKSRLPCLFSTTWRHRKHPGYFLSPMTLTEPCLILVKPTITQCRMSKIDTRTTNQEAERTHP